MKPHVLACSGQGMFWCNQQTHNANAWVFLLIPLTIIGFAAVTWIVVKFRQMAAEEKADAARRRYQHEHAQDRKNTENQS